MIKQFFPLPWRIKVRRFLDSRANSPKVAYRRVSALGKSSKNDWIRKSAGIPGWLFEGEHEFLYKMALSAPKGAFVEIGSLFGKSSCILAGAIKDRANGETLFAIDPFTVEGSEQDSTVHRETHNQSSTFSSFVRNAKMLDFYDVVVPLATFSQKILPALNIDVGFAFIDGCHEEPSIVQDFTLIERLCVEGAIVLFHDAGDAYPGVEAAITRILGAFPHARRVGGSGTIVAIQLEGRS